MSALFPHTGVSNVTGNIPIDHTLSPVNNLVKAVSAETAGIGQTQPPSQAAASTTAIQAQLSKEQNARSTASILTTPSGLTDEPSTTSSLLTGA